MNKREGIIFLFTIAKEIEQSFQCPIIFFTEIDYADYIVKSLMNMREALKDNANPKKLVNIVNAFHYEWLQAVQDIDMYRKRLKDMPREVVLRAINFTMKCLEDRYKYLCKYMQEMKSTLTNEENLLMEAHLDIIDEIKEINLSALLEKQKNIHLQADQAEYLNNVQDELEELLNWLDRINDSLALHFLKVLDLKVPVLPSDLTKTLKQIVAEVADDPDPEAQKIAGLIHSKSKLICQTVRDNALHELEMTRIIDKIKDLEDRISRLQVENSSALMALQHKTIYLEDRLQSLENMKLSMIRLKSENALSGGQNIDNRIFNHILPQVERHRLVERLVKLWDSAISERDHESIISILSVGDLKEIFSDVLGHFSVDKYGRKIYSKENDPKLYQVNEYNELIVVKDDDRHVYFYDECGRYYLDTNNRRVYKAHEVASEYLLNKTGILYKIKETRDGIDYFYDWLGRYRINRDGKKIYNDGNSSSEYEDDGLGNLSKIVSRQYIPEPRKNVTLSIEENRYLQQAVGPALKKCIANVILHQPYDPILYLVKCLMSYRQNLENRQRRLDDEHEMFQDRVLYSMTKENSEITYLDYVAEYQTRGEEDF